MTLMSNFIVITGPSGVGKTVLVDVLLRKVPNSTRFITFTTRTARPNEKDGQDYYFISREKFEERKNRNDFFEHAVVYGNLYGSSKEKLDELLEKFDYVFAVIDVQGAKTLKEKLPDSIVISLQPGNLDEIKQRLQNKRMDIPPQELEKRLQEAEKEIKLANTFDFTVENPEGMFEETVKRTLGLILV